MDHGGHDHHEHHDHESHDPMTTTAATIVKELLVNVTESVANVTKEIIETANEHIGHENHNHGQDHDHSEHFNHGHSEHVDHSSHSHIGHEMKMYFHGGSQEVILFDFWRIESCFGLIVSCLFIFILGAAYEGIKWFRIHQQLKDTKRIQRKRVYSPAVSVSMNHPPQCSGASPDKVAISLNQSQQKESLLYPANGDPVYVPTVKEPEPDDASVGFFDFTAIRKKAKAKSRMVQAGLYCTQITLAYFLMLIAMTYNTYLTAAVVLGAGFGHWLFALIQDSAPAANVDTVDAVSSDACH